MTKINSGNAVNPSFQGRLHLTKMAADNLNEKMQKLAFSKQRRKVLNEYDKFIHKVINSNFDVYVSELPEGDLLANVSKSKSSKMLAYAINKNNIFSKIGIKNPIKFMQKAFQKAQKSSE